MLDGLMLLAQVPAAARVEPGPSPVVGPGPAPTGAPVPTAAAPVTGAATPEAGTTIQPSTTSKPGPRGFFDGPLGSILPIILMFVLLYFILFRGQRKEEKRRKGLIAELKKGDRVMTIGGLVARVVSIDGEEVVLKIDESANVKATFRKSAIQEVLGGDDKK